MLWPTLQAGTRRIVKTVSYTLSDCSGNDSDSDHSSGLVLSLMAHRLPALGHGHPGGHYPAVGRPHSGGLPTVGAGMGLQMTQINSRVTQMEKTLTLQMKISQEQEEKNEKTIVRICSMMQDVFRDELGGEGGQKVAVR